MFRKASSKQFKQDNKKKENSDEDTFSCYESSDTEKESKEEELEL
jgi:hypothetical protein